MKQMQLGMIFADHLLDKAWAIGKDHDLLMALCEEHLDEINERTEQENSPGYLAYTLEHAMGVAGC